MRMTRNFVRVSIRGFDKNKRRYFFVLQPWGKKAVEQAITTIPYAVRPLTNPHSDKHRTSDSISMTAAIETATEEVPVKPEEVALAVWTEIEKLRDEIPPPDAASGLYPDSKAADAFQAADQAVASLCAVPRDQMLEGFTKLVEGPRLNDLLNALVSSDDHPALQHSCLMVMCGVASLKQAHDEVTKRRDVLKSLLGALAKPKPHRISPVGAEEDLDVNPAVGAAICLNRYVCASEGVG